MATPTIQKVALLGADGNLGPAILHALEENGFKVTVFKRVSSKSKTCYPSQKTISDEFPVDELIQALQGIDAMVVTIKSSETDLQKRIADACVKAGVKRFIPADFGSVDSSSSLTQELVPLYVHKSNLRKYLIELAEKHLDFTWTSLVTGHFFDWSLEFLHINLKEHIFEVLDDGEAKWSTSTLSRIAEATALVLQRLDVTKNRMLYVQSFLVSQNEVLASFEKATGSKWEVIRHDSEHYKNEEREKAEAGDAEAVENLVWYLAAVDANWELRQNFAMNDLGLQNEDLDSVVKNTVKKLQT